MNAEQVFDSIVGVLDGVQPALARKVKRNRAIVLGMIVEATARSRPRPRTFEVRTITGLLPNVVTEIDGKLYAPFGHRYMPMLRGYGVDLHALVDKDKWPVPAARYGFLVGGTLSDWDLRDGRGRVELDAYDAFGRPQQVEVMLEQRPSLRLVKPGMPSARDTRPVLDFLTLLGYTQAPPGSTDARVLAGKLGPVFKRDKVGDLTAYGPVQAISVDELLIKLQRLASPSTYVLANGYDLRGDPRVEAVLEAKEQTKAADNARALLEELETRVVALRDSWDPWPENTRRRADNLRHELQSVIQDVEQLPDPARAQLQVQVGAISTVLASIVPEITKRADAARTAREAAEAQAKVEEARKRLEAARAATEAREAKQREQDFISAAVAKTRAALSAAVRPALGLQVSGVRRFASADKTRWGLLVPWLGRFEGRMWLFASDGVWAVGVRTPQFDVEGAVLSPDVPNTTKLAALTMDAFIPALQEPPQLPHILPGLVENATTYQGHSADVAQWPERTTTNGLVVRVAPSKIAVDKARADDIAALAPGAEWYGDASNVLAPVIVRHEERIYVLMPVRLD